MMILKVKHVAIQAGMLLLLFQTAQTQSTRESLRNSEPRGCEFNTIDLRGASNEAGAESILILIARRGAKDRKGDISGRRLHTARAYLADYSKTRRVDTIVVAESLSDGRRPEFGGVEVYVNGKLMDFLTSRPDQDLSIGYCSSVEPSAEERHRLRLLYPWRFRRR